MSSADHEDYHDVDRDLLADYVGGALAGTAENDYVAELVATSPQWRAAAEELRAALQLVSRDLAVLRDRPEEMPTDIADRFDELLAPPKSDPLAARPVVRTAGGKRPRKWKRWAAPVAVAAAALTFFGLGQVPQLATSKSEDMMSGGRADAPAPEVQGPGAAAAVGVPTIRTGAQYSRQNVSRSRMASQEAASLNFSQDNGDVRREAWQRLDQPQALSACLNVVSAALPGRQNLVEFAYFERQPALVISITAKTGGEWLLVAGMSCGLGGADELYRAPQQ